MTNPENSLGPEKNILEALHQNRLADRFCDLTIRIGDRSFRAHKVILVSRMEYFDRMFSHADMVEHNADSIELDSSIVDPEVFQDILEYIYRLEINLTTSNAPLICFAARYFCFDELLSLSVAFMLQNIDVDNVAQCFSLADTNELPELREKCVKFIARNQLPEKVFQEVTKILSDEVFREVLAEKEKCMAREEVFYLIVNWADYTDNIDNLSELLQKIPLKSLPLRFLKEVVAKNVLVQTHCKELLDEAINNSFQNESLIVIGGLEGWKYLSTVSRYDSNIKKWSQEPEVREIGLSNFGCAAVGIRVYVWGGHDGNQDRPEIRMYEPKIQKWTVLDDRTDHKESRHYWRYHLSRSNFGLAVLDGCLYVAGGLREAYISAVLERYSTADNTVKQLAEMPTKRWGLELVELNGFLYAIGGSNGQTTLKTVERYDPKTDQWSAVSETGNAYSMFGACSYKRKIYIIGGDKAEVYTPERDSWDSFPAPPERCDYGRRMVVFNGKLTLVGGSTGKWKEWTGSRKIYCFENGKWEQIGDMDAPRCFHGVAVVQSELES